MFGTAESIELLLKSESFNVYTTDLGEEGVDLGKLYDYDIILLDLNLPDMSGYEVLRSLRVAEERRLKIGRSGVARGRDLGLARPQRRGDVREGPGRQARWNDDDTRVRRIGSDRGGRDADDLVERRDRLVARLQPAAHLHVDLHRRRRARRIAWW